MNKKGFIDNIYLMVIFLGLFFVTIVGSVIYTNVMDKLEGTDFVNDTDVQTAITSVDASMANNDNVVSMLFFGLIIGILITLYFVRSNPVFFIIGVIGLIIVVFLAIILRSTFTDIIDSDASFSNASAEMPKSNFILENLPVILLIVISGFLIFLYISKGGATSG